MTLLHADFESKSILSLKKCGLDRYMHNSRPLMLAWAFDGDEPEIWEPKFGPLPKEVVRAAKSDVKFVAWNSGFERTGFRTWLSLEIPYDRWIDPSTQARTLSLPGSLKDVSIILGLGDDGKDKEGKRLIKKFCEPADMGGEVTLFGVTEPYFREPEKHTEDWEKFREYCKQDVRAERTILHKLEPFQLTETERKIWYLDQKINDRGLPVNRALSQKERSLAERSKKELQDILKEKTGVVNPNSGDQMLAWLAAQGYTYGSIEKSTVALALADTRVSKLAKEVLILRKEASKSSHTKLETLVESLSEDDCLRHQFVYLGAARTGRWSGYGVQFQNLPRPIKEVEDGLDRALDLIDAQDYDTIKKEYPSVIGMAVSCIRSVFQSPAGKKFVVGDLSAIENRVIGWLSGCYSILQVFHNGLDPYVSFAVKMYNQPYEILLKDKPKRQIAKPAVLGAGFGLGPGARKICKHCRKPFGYKQYCKKCRTDECDYEVILKKNKHGDLKKTGLLGYADNMGVVMTPKQAFSAQRTFRQSYPEVVAYWKVLEDAAMEVLTNGGEVQVGVVMFSMALMNEKNVMRILLPSGRTLHYMNAAVIERDLVGDDDKPYKKTSIVYDGIGHGVGTVDEKEGGKGSKWGPVFTYGGKLCENIVQAIARDILAHGMLLVDEAGGLIVGHVHDELICLADDNGLDFSLDDLKNCMSVTPGWAEKLPLAAEGFESRIYRKG